MAIVNGSLQEGYKNAAWFAANPTLVLLEGQRVNLEQTGTYKLGDGITQLSALSFLGNTASTPWGDITGTISNQTDLQNALNGKENSITAGTTAQYWRGDKTFQTLDKTSVGLGNVDNTSDANKPISSATQTALDGKVDENAAIVGATKTKITYDSKGLVTSGTDATTADIADSTNKRYVTDAQLTIIGNTSGTNSGNETTSTIGSLINGSSAATPNNTDLVATVESSVLKKITWTNVKAFLKTYFDTIYQAAGTYLTSANITQTITNGVTDKAPSEDAVFDALALKDNSFTFSCALPSSNPADSTTYFFGARSVVLTQNTTSNTNRFWIPSGYTKISLVGVAFVVQAGTPSSENVSLYLRLNDTTDYLMGTFPIILATSGNPFVFLEPNITGLTTSDFFEFKLVCPAWATNPTSVGTNLFAKISK